MILKAIDINPSQGFVSRFAPKPETLAQAKRRIYDNIPDNMMSEMGAKLYLIANLTWSYVDTVIQMCRIHGIPQTKPQSRSIRELKRRYDQFRSSSMGVKECAQEEEMSQWFEEMFEEDFNRLFAGIDLKMGKVDKGGCPKDYIVALVQALTLVDATFRYSSYCDSRLRELDVPLVKHSLLQNEFIAMKGVMALFPGTAEEAFSGLRDTCSRILVNRLHSLLVSSENGRLILKKV